MRGPEQRGHATDGRHPHPGVGAVPDQLLDHDVDDLVDRLAGDQEPECGQNLTNSSDGFTPHLRMFVSDQIQHEAVLHLKIVVPFLSGLVKIFYGIV